MKKTSIYIVLSIALTSISALQASEQKLFSSMGYPYKLLLSRANTVKIIYTGDKKDIHCKVEVNWNNETITSQHIKVEKKAFEQKPLASCLPRAQAKTILAKTFN